jgi:actin-related protein
LTLTYHPGQPDKVRERMLEVAFDYFHFDSFYPALS